MNFINILIEELKKKNIVFSDEYDMKKKLEHFVSSYNFLSLLKKQNPKVNDSFCEVLDSLTIEQILILKFELSTKKTKDIILPKWFFSYFQDILNFIIVKYVLSVFGTFSGAAQYLDIDEKLLFDILKKTELYLPQKANASEKENV